jgi:hypothetical protein
MSRRKTRARSGGSEMPDEPNLTKIGSMKDADSVRDTIYRKLIACY